MAIITVFPRQKNKKKKTRSQRAHKFQFAYPQSCVIILTHPSTQAGTFPLQSVNPFAIDNSIYNPNAPAYGTHLPNYAHQTTSPFNPANPYANPPATTAAPPSVSSPTSPTSPTALSLTGSSSDPARALAEEDKRRRNTAASARFRVKKKQREQALEQKTAELEKAKQTLEQRVGQLETENEWLRGLVVEKNGGKRGAGEGKREGEKEEGERSIGGKKKGVGTEA